MNRRVGIAFLVLCGLPRYLICYRVSQPTVKLKAGPPAATVGPGLLPSSQPLGQGVPYMKFYVTDS